MANSTTTVGRSPQHMKAYCNISYYRNTTPSDTINAAPPIFRQHCPTHYHTGPQLAPVEPIKLVDRATHKRSSTLRITVSNLQAQFAPFTSPRHNGPCLPKYCTPPRRPHPALVPLLLIRPTTPKSGLVLQRKRNDRQYRYVHQLQKS